MQIELHRLLAGQAPPAGSTVYLCRGELDARRELEYFAPSAEWRCPETRDGHWYGYTTDAETEAYLRDQFGVG